MGDSKSTYLRQANRATGLDTTLPALFSPLSLTLDPDQPSTLRPQLSQPSSQPHGATMIRQISHLEDLAPSASSGSVLQKLFQCKLAHHVYFLNLTLFLTLYLSKIFFSLQLRKFFWRPNFSYTINHFIVCVGYHF
jgi:hypothetical protein